MATIRALVVKMAAANPLWGAPRIPGELRTLGLEVSERTVSRLLRSRRRPPSQTWRTFLTNHVGTVVSMDFFTVPTGAADTEQPRVLVVLSTPDKTLDIGVAAYGRGVLGRGIRGIGAAFDDHAIEELHELPSQRGFGRKARHAHATDP